MSENVHSDITEEMDSGFKPGTESFGEVDMSAPISEDDLMRAGGFGTRDAIGSAFPEAVDATDFEEAVNEPLDESEEHTPVSHTGIGFQEGEESGAVAEEDDLSHQTLNDYFVPASGHTQGIPILMPPGTDAVPRLDACFA
eukprot:TRINITY_DN5905_c0_g1_i4.p1 TRINITY_DN5905_c0_g1~~TRINITY_DN5905_c0_g1_i4.p1  ORF type:complete len:141 (+),score=8.50 TRINITY_DN5905_c0_g1_i4:193-615(+)